MSWVLWLPGLVRAGFIIGVVNGCAPAPSTPPGAVPDPTTTVPAVPVASAAATPATTSALPKLRFPPGAAAPRLGCFGWSEKNRTHACVWGHFEPEPEGRSLFVAFVGGEKRAPIRLVQGAFDDATRAALDEAMLSGDYRVVEEEAWTPTGAPLVLGSFRVVTEGETIRIEHSGHSIFERTTKQIPRFTPTCETRLLPAGPEVVVERRCRVMDEGLEVIEMDVYGCDEQACK